MHHLFIAVAKRCALTVTHVYRRSICIENVHVRGALLFILSIAVMFMDEAGLHEYAHQSAYTRNMYKLETVVVWEGEDSPELHPRPHATLSLLS